MIFRYTIKEFYVIEGDETQISLCLTFSVGDRGKRVNFLPFLLAVGEFASILFCAIKFLVEVGVFRT